MTLAAGTRLGPYEILAPLGAGGMGEVYRARDTKLDRDVAIKVLPESVAASPHALARFEREAKAVAALSHPNILAIYDFGRHDGVAYAVMELLKGETLRGKLNAGAISPKQAVEYALQIAKGLSAAHDRGVVHRDLKPENLFVTKDGHVKILDFGLAKRVETQPGPDETNTPTETDPTTPGTVLGTVGYMSPEQVRGLSADHRSDIFSFGAILYELLSGQRAFRRQTGADTMAAILREDPPKLTASGARIPASLALAVSHCLEKDPANRFQSARDLALALSDSFSSPTATGVRHVPVKATRGRWAIAAAAVLLVAAGGVLFLRRPSEAPPSAPVMKRVAVLPFENLGSPEDDYFADGIADAVRGKLTSFSGVQVIARGSSTPYKKTTKTPQLIARELDARYLLTATVRWQKSGGTSRVQLSPELVEVQGSGAPTSKWQQPFDAALTDVFQVQSDIASRVAQALGVALGAGEEKRLSEKPTQSLAAYDAFLKGEEASKSMTAYDHPSLRRALGFYEQAVALDPGFAQAWGRVSQGNSRLNLLIERTPAIADGARKGAEKAVALAPDRPESYLALGDYQLNVTLDANRALEHYATGQRLAPGNPDFLTSIALTEVRLGRWKAAVGHFRQAEGLDPRSVSAKQSLADTLLQLRRYVEARETVDAGLALSPTDLWLIQCKAMTFLALGDLAGARAVLRAAADQVEPTALVAYVGSSLGLVWALDEQQRDLLVRLTPSAFEDNRAIWGITLAEAAALKGDTASTRTYAEEAARAFEEQLRGTVGDAELHARRGLALGYGGRKEEAVREGERAVALVPTPFLPYYHHQLARIYILVGEPEKALDLLEPLLKIPYYLSPGWLKIDPNFDPLRKNPRFQKLVAGG